MIHGCIRYVNMIGSAGIPAIITGQELGDLGSRDVFVPPELFLFCL